MSTVETTATATPIAFAPGQIVAQVSGAWDDQQQPVLYSVQAQANQVLAVVLSASTIAGTTVSSPSGAVLGYGNLGLGYSGKLEESGTYTIQVGRSHMGTEGNGSFILGVVLAAPVLD